MKDVLNFGHSREVQAGLDYVAAWNCAFLPSEDLAEAMRGFDEQRRHRVQEVASDDPD